MRLRIKSANLEEGMAQVALWGDLAQFRQEGIRVTQGLSGSHIAEVCRRAALLAFKESGFSPARTRLQMNHLLEALRLLKKTAQEIEKPRIGLL